MRGEKPITGPPRLFKRWPLRTGDRCGRGWRHEWQAERFRFRWRPGKKVNGAVALGARAVG
eukprot:2568088-Alexandrium_andersonii.AAC.1